MPPTPDSHAEIDSDPFLDGPHTAEAEFEAAHLRHPPALSESESPARDLYQRIATRDLVTAARHHDADGTLHAIGTFRSTGRHVLLKML